jgi:thymidylate synthase ThyX
MTPERQVYLLDPQKLDPETIAVAFAKTSRSPQSFRKIAAELTSEKSAEFHEKWVVGYGHASVAEHAVLHVAIENVSRLAVETIESNRLASYTEKSTRYQKWSPEEFYTPAELCQEPEIRQLYIETCQDLFDTYQQTLPLVRAEVERNMPRQDGESDGAWERRIRSEYVDVCRFLLPAASLANLGMTINARALEHALRKMLSHPLAEVREIGEQIKAVALESIPTLLKYVDRVPYLMDTVADLTQRAADLTQRAADLTQRAADLALPGAGFDAHNGQAWCQLVDCSPAGEARVLAAALYRFGEISYTQALNHVNSLNEAGKAALAQALLGRLGRHDIPLRETELAHYTFDVVVDQGGYFELKRHRMMTQTAQPLTAALGYAVPKRIVTAGAGDPYCRAMDRAVRAYETLAKACPEAASYVVPNGCNRRVLLEMNLRSADHFTSLRSAENAHFSMRRLALRMAEQIRAATPLLGRYLRVQPGETWQQIEEQYFSSIA